MSTNTMYNVIVPTGSFPLADAAKALTFEAQQEKYRIGHMERHYKQLLEDQRKINQLTKYRLEKDFTAYIESEKISILECDDPRDVFREYCDSYIPHMHWELLQYAANESWFREVDDDEGLLPKKPTIFNIVQCAIYETLQGVGYGVFNDFKESGYLVKQVERWDNHAERLEDLAEDNEDYAERLEYAQSRAEYWKDLFDKLEDF